MKRTISYQAFSTGPAELCPRIDFDPYLVESTTPHFMSNENRVPARYSGAHL